MSTKKLKVNNRVKFNTFLFVLAAFIFAAFSFLSMINLAKTGTTLQQISNQRGLCFDETVDPDGTKGTENEGVCSSDPEKGPLSDNIQDVAMFLYDKVTYTETMAAYRSAYSTFIIGLMFTFASLFGGVIYWNHNKAK